MNMHVLDPRTDRDLRALDAAAGVSGDPARRSADLHAILAAPLEPHDGMTAAPASTPARAHARSPLRRWVAVGVAAAATTGIAVLVPALTAAPSYASWTSRPDTVRAADVALVREACLDQQGSSIGDGAVSTRDLRVVLAERRGDFVAMLLSKEYGARMSASVHCLANLPPGSTEVSDVETGATSGGGLPAPTGRQFTQGATGQFGGDDPASLTEGEVGSDVVGLTLHADGHDVVATVSGGRYAAWWPGRAFTGGDLPPGEGGPGLAITYDVTYADGTVERGVAPASS